MCLLVASSKSRKVLVTVAGLAEGEVDKTLYCWSCVQEGHAKNDCLLKQRQTQTIDNPKQKPIVPAKDSMKGGNNHLPKQFKCSHCGRNNHSVQNCFILHQEKRHFSKREKMLEAKIGALEKRFKNLALSDQILDSPSSSGAQASSSTLDYYVFKASGEVVSSAAVTRAQIVSRARPSTTGESVDNLRAWDNGPVDHIGGCCPICQWS